MGQRQCDLPHLRRERNRSLSRQRPELVPAVVLNMGGGDLNSQRLKASNAAFTASDVGASSNPRVPHAWVTATFHAPSIVISRGTLNRPVARVVLPDVRLVVQDHVQQGVTDFQFSVVLDIAQFAELIHEEAYARPASRWN
jgi:hypothetical protein